MGELGPSSRAGEDRERIIEGVFQREVSTDKIELVNNAVHWSYRALWGMLYGLVQGSVRAEPLRLGLVLGVGLWGFSYVARPAVKLYKPFDRAVTR